MTDKQKVKRKYPNAGIMFSVMRGHCVVDYGKDGYGDRILAYSVRSEADAWTNAARKQRRGPY